MQPRTLLPLLYAAACAGCVTTHGVTDPREQLSMPLNQPTCVVFCFVRVDVSDNDGGSEEPPPPTQGPPP
jgi:hypothetical protein